MNATLMSSISQLRNQQNLSLWVQDILDRLAENDENITELNQSSRGMGDGTVVLVANALRKNTYLQKLVLALNRIGPAGAKALTKVLKARNYCGSLVSLELWDNRVGNGGAQALGQMLKHNNTLQRLHLAKNGITHIGAKALANGLKHNQTLSKLFLGRNIIGNQGAAAFGDMLKINQSLQFLNVFGNCIGSNGAVELATGLQQNQTMKMLYMSYNEIGNAGVIALSKVNLHILNVGGSTIQDWGVAGFANNALCRHSSLRDLTLGQITLEYEGAMALGKALQINTTLQTLTLYGNIHDGAIEHISLGLSSNTCLHELSLSENGNGDLVCKALGKALMVNTYLKRLHLNNVNTGNKGLSSLLVGLEHNSSLEKLSLSGNRIDGDSLGSLASMLLQNHSLRELHVTCNNITNQQIRSSPQLTRALDANLVLTKLVLQDEKFLSEEHVLYLRSNRVGRRLLRETSSDMIAVWPHVLARATSDPAVLYHLCCAKPDLYQA